MNFRYTFLSVLISAILLSYGCSDSTSPVDDNSGNFDFSKIISDYTDNVVVATYSDLMTQSALLKTACSAFIADSTQTNLENAAAAWKNTRVAWESSEAFLFGPVSFLSIDPSIDTWPLDESQLKSVLQSDFELTPDFVRNGLGYSLRGFHTIEYFLFKEGQIRNSTELSRRDKEYLVAASTVLAEDAEMLYNEWINGFADEFKNAGETGSRYSSVTQALLQIVEGMSAIADEVGNGKISEPYITGNVMTVESQFSWNSLTDFSYNIQGIKNVYTGIYKNGTDGNGLEEYISEADNELNIRFKDQIETTLAAINNIPSPFRNNLSSSTQIQFAIDECNKLFEMIETEIKPAVSK